jgi:hypothetical protein
VPNSIANVPFLFLENEAAQKVVLRAMPSEDSDVMPKCITGTVGDDSEIR